MMREGGNMSDENDLELEIYEAEYGLEPANRNEHWGLSYLLGRV